jgi:hypothetical protein
MSTRVAAVLVGILLFGARQTAACSAMNWDPNDLVENTPVFSANGRFCAVVRHHEGITDFTAERAGKVFRFDDPEPLDDFEETADTVPAARRPVIAALYETGARRTLLAEIPLDAETAGSVLVSDSGRFLVVTGGSGGGGCGGYLRADDPLVLIHTVSVTGAALLKVSDILTPSDATRLSMGDAAVSYSLRHESDASEVLVLSFAAQPRNMERRIDLAGGALLDEKRDLYPAPRVYATATGAELRRDYEPSSGCADGFGGSDLLRLDSNELFARAVAGPLPPFPVIALKARIRGMVRVEVIVSETGDVLCTRRTPFPFGIADAAEQAVRRWRFRPVLEDGRPVKAVGEILVHFKDLSEDEWRERTLQAPPAVD